jgi:hypothetical protein
MPPKDLRKPRARHLRFGDRGEQPGAAFGELDVVR